MSTLSFLKNTKITKYTLKISHFKPLKVLYFFDCFWTEKKTNTIRNKTCQNNIFYFFKSCKK